MAFGAGALPSALALEPVVPALEPIPDDPLEGFKWLALGSLIGCLAFIGLDHLRSEMGGYLRKTSTIASRLKRLKKKHYHSILANFPENMSSAVVMNKQGSSSLFIIGMWVSLMIMTAVGAAYGNLFIADAPPHLHGLLEGMAAGAGLASIARTMLPEAYDHGGWLTGLMTVTGFLCAIWMGMLTI